MNQADLFGWFGHGGDPVQQHALVGMGGVGAEPVDGGLGWDLVVDHLSARGAFGLIADENDTVAAIGKTLFEMAEDAAAGGRSQKTGDRLVPDPSC